MIANRRRWALAAGLLGPLGAGPPARADVVDAVHGRAVAPPTPGPA